jgi:hypothetical protein
VLNRVDRLIVADAPGWRSDSGSELNAPPIQQILAERTNDAGDTVSQYVAIMVPYASEASPVRSAGLITGDPISGAIAVQITLPGRTDTIISALDHEEHQYGAVTLAGQFGFVSVDEAGTVQQAYLLAGTRLSCGQQEIALPSPVLPIKVKSAADRTFHLDEALPDKFDPKGHYLLAGETGYEIESTTDNSITVRDYPAIDCQQLTVLNSAWLDESR